MSKRKVNKQQSRRIQARQLYRQVSGEHEGLVISHFGKQADIECADGTIIRARLRQHLGNIVAGDRVTYADDVITSLHPRQTTLGRPDKRGEIRPVAANITQMIIVVAQEPALQTDLLDRYLVAAETLGISPIICVNKTDIITPVTRQALQPYQALNYQFVETCAPEQKGITPLEARLKNQTSVFVGQSGVGKSSLINQILPTETLRVGLVSEQSRLGKHTTTSSYLYHIPTGGDIIDSPGIREFGLWHMPVNEIAKGFVEFRAFLGQCKFSDCSHQHEPQCALLNAVKSGAISRARYNNFIHIIKKH